MFNKERITYVSLEEADKIIKLENKKGETGENRPYTHIALNDSILMLLSSIDYNKKIISRTLLQREVFLFYEDILNDIGLSTGASDAGYFPYKYGPYSIDVNISMSVLIFSGKILVSNYYSNGEENKKFLTVFETKQVFENIAKKYEELLADKGLSIGSFHKKIVDRKISWDQSKPNGITKLLLSKGFKGWYNKKSLDKVYPSIYFGKVREEYKPRVNID